MSVQTRAALLSYLRVLLGTVATAIIAVQAATERQVLDFLVADWKAVASSLVGAALVTAVNFARKGETRFGRGHVDIGMGGDDTLGPGGEVQRDAGHADGGPYGWPGLLIALVVVLLLLRIFGVI